MNNDKILQIIPAPAGMAVVNYEYDTGDVYTSAVVCLALVDHGRGQSVVAMEFAHDLGVTMEGGDRMGYLLPGEEPGLEHYQKEARARFEKEKAKTPKK